MKVCTKCGVEKDESEFHKNHKRCKGCFNKQTKEYRTKNRALVLERKKKYRIENKEEILEKQKEYYNENIEKRLDYAKEYRNKNPDKNKEYMKEYYITHKEEKKIYGRKYNKERYDSDPYYRFTICLRSRIRIAFKNYSIKGKSKSCKEYGIDFKSIYDKIGYKDDPTMHLDHVIPLSVFDLDNPEHVRLAHLPENLRWLDATENLQKHDSIDMQLIRCSLVLTIIAQEIGII